MALHLRQSEPADIQFMGEMLYEAVFWRPNPKKPSLEDGLADPGARTALADWGEREGDAAVIALVDSKPAGAAWYRFYTDDNCIRENGACNRNRSSQRLSASRHWERND